MMAASLAVVFWAENRNAAFFSNSELSCCVPLRLGVSCRDLGGDHNSEGEASGGFHHSQFENIDEVRDSQDEVRDSQEELTNDQRKG